MIQNDARMTFTEHLGELRTRLIRSCVAILVSFILCYIVHEQIFNLVRWPLNSLKQQGIIVEAGEGNSPETAVDAEQNPPADKQEPVQDSGRGPWRAFNPMEPFLVQLRLSLYAGFILALPVVIYQLCAFVFPGLTASERKIVRFLLIGTAVFAIFGVAVAYFAVFPMVMPYLATFVPKDVVIELRMSETVGQILMGMLGFAVAFQFPMVVMVFVYLDLLSPDTLRKYRRHAIVVLAIGAAAFTPPDPFSMMAMLVPLGLMYEISIWASVIMLRKRRRAEAAADASQAT